MKRLFDFLTSLVALILLSPVLLVVALRVSRKLGSPVFFRQTRPGKDGKPGVTGLVQIVGVIRSQMALGDYK